MTKRKYRYIAIDWSGGEKKSYVSKSISVAAAERGESRVRLLGPPDGWRWTRETVFNYLKDEAMKAEPVIVGIDCNFSLPVTNGEYVPGMSAESAPNLWREIKKMCECVMSDPKCRYRSADAFYGRGFVDVYREQFKLPNKRTPKEYTDRYRETEKRAQKIKGVNPASAFNLAAGQRQVGMGGLSGMAALHWLTQEAGVNDKVAVWPFHPEPQSVPMIVVEIFPTLHRRSKSGGAMKIDTREKLDDLLSKNGFAFNDALTHSLNDHDTDALVSAAEMAKAPENPCEWMPRGLDRKMRETEGWIFGVGADWTGL